ncbi:Cell adhesion molecule 2 [Takifugu flavidus]|uniref:Cell adhesion molecule 2 n=1 Tax=Takifugu flavidus TaxID=433684 RepID=A0A5C6P4F1_9TELE|nr:Cell adhesion molecule 2 [Takifugu flavidus]
MQMEDTLSSVSAGVEVGLGAKEVNASGKTFTVQSSLQLHVDRNDDGVAYTCKVDHVALTAKPQQATEVLEVHYAPQVEIIHSLAVPQEGQFLKLECVSKGNPLPDPVIWTKDGGELPDLDRMIVEGRELTFTSLNKTDNGTYRCEASNLLGTNSAEYVLFVYDTPTTLPPSTTPPLHPNPADHTVLLGTRASDPALTGDRVQLSECFLLPCKRSFHVPPSAESRVQDSLSRIQKGFLPSKPSIYCPRGISQYFCARNLKEANVTSS